MAELDGRPSGVTVFDVGGDEGYRWIAPSLERMFETWVALTEAGLGSLAHPPTGEALLTFRRFDRNYSKAYDICHRHSCRIAAAGIWGFRE